MFIREFVNRLVIVVLLFAAQPVGALACKFDPDQVDNALFSLLDEPKDQVKHSDVNCLMRMLSKEGVTDRLYTFREDTPKDTLRMYTLFWVSDYYLQKKRYSLAAKSASLALPLCKQNADKQLYVDCLAKLIVSHYQLGNENACRPFIKEIGPALNKHHFNQATLSKLVGVSMVEEKMGLFDECRNTLDYILKFHKCDKKDRRLAHVYVRFAGLMHRDGNIGLSEGYYKQAKDIYAHHSDIVSQCMVEYYLFKLLEKVNEEASQRHYDAYSDLHDSIEMEYGQDGVDELDSLMTANGHEMPEDGESHNRSKAVLILLFIAIALLFGVSLPILRRNGKGDKPETEAKDGGEAQAETEAEDSGEPEKDDDSPLADEDSPLADDGLPQPDNDNDGGGMAEDNGNDDGDDKQSDVEAPDTESTRDEAAAEGDSDAGTDAEGVADFEHEAGNRFVGAFKSAVEERMEGGAISLEELASDLCVSRGQLNRKVKAASGITTSNYILGMRLDKARKLLADNPDMPINIVAQQCGFDNFSYFNRLFKREVGVTPSEFRRRHHGS